MKQYQQEIDARFPVRRTREQKQAFRLWAAEELRAMGYRVQVEENGLMRHQNLVVGDPERVPVLFTAHYDTPARTLLPHPATPRNPILYLGCQLLIVLALMLLTALVMPLVTALGGSPVLARTLWLALYLAMLLLMAYGGPACRRNAIDNTSGVAAVMELLAALPPEDRGKAAVILFDDGTRGLAGSKAYAKDHLQVAYTRLTVNLDCVGAGEHLLVISRKLARQQLGFGPLQRALESLSAPQAHFFDSKGSVENSDHKNFKSSVVVCACRRAKVLGYHIPHGEAAQEQVIDALSGALAAYVSSLRT